ncbi:TetR/AcrR family transcriptional regulator [Nocardia bovistercoris]|uniref:TetR/AcrR family transcriptional regulator n=1 Tax=Nocardia bovistercoris TaxID=2785916 RepID=A0A931N3X9_9NOCA|nr:TetR/AcrR family transcriptional regulator [Nocardia bovistercoris]MBH0781130.1 TetR/AcrR family transcriptional regulator [Nocardia bovistercoris]
MERTPSARPLRADAKRNRDRLLERARELFLERGIDAPLEEIAARAGVGVGTLYRHFPTREALLEYLLRERFDALTELANELARESEPGAALREWTLRFVEATTVYRGLVGALTATLHDPGSALHAACERMRGVGADLLARAREAGRMRADVSTEEFLTLVAGVAWSGEQMPDASPHERRRLLSLMFEGLERD